MKELPIAEMHGNATVPTSVRSRFLLLCFVSFIGLFFSLGCKPASVTTTATAVGPIIEKVTDKGPVKLTIRLSPAEPRLSDLVEMEILVSGKEKIAFDAPVFGQAVGDFLVRDYSERSTDMRGKPIESNSRLFRYQLEPTQTGKHLIRSIGIEFTDNRPESESAGQKLRIESEPVEVTVTSELGDDTPDLANAEPMVAPKAITNNMGWLWLIPAAILIAFFGMLLWFTRTKKGSAPSLPQQTPEEIANAQLAQLLAEELPAKGLFKDFYLRLTGIVRSYIEGTTGIRAPEQTTEEFLRAARSKDFFSVEQSMRLQDFLEAADMVKYAGQQPEADQIETSITRARGFIALKPSVPMIGVVSPMDSLKPQSVAKGDR